MSTDLLTQGRDLIEDGAALSRVQTQYVTAVQVQRPRDLAQVQRGVMTESDLLGASAYYKWGHGADQVLGPSKELANVLARCWGNCAIELGPVQEKRDAWIFTAYFIDHETGFTLPRQFRQSKNWVVHGKFDAARKEDIRFQIGQSKAIRNVILNAIPSWLVDRAVDQALGNVRKGIEARVAKDGLDAVAANAVASLGRMGVSEKRVLEAFGRHSAKALTIDDLVVLAGSAKALASGAETADVLFPEKAAQSPIEVAKRNAAAVGLMPVERPADPSEQATPASEDAPPVETPAAQPDEPPNLISEAQRRRLFAITSERGVSKPTLDEFLRSHGVDSTNRITVDFYEQVIDWARTRPA